MSSVAHPMNEGIKIRQAVERDADAIRTLTREAYSKWVPVIGREPLPMSADYDKALSSHRFDLLFQGRKLIGLVETIAKRDHLLIENIAVSPAHQGKGVGRRLLEHAERHAAFLGYSEIKLYTNKAFAENLNYYANRGYRVEREEEFMGGICVHMNKCI